MEGIMQTQRADVPLLRSVARYNALIMLIVLFAVSSIMSPAFLSEENLYNLLRQLTPLLLVSLGMLLVINTGGIDLSVGSIAAAGGLLAAMLVPVMPFGATPGLLLAVVLSVTLGALFGAFNGILVTAFGLAPFIVTLAMMTIARGVTYMMSNGQPTMLPLDLPAAELLNEFGSGSVPWLNVPWPVVLAAGVALLFYFLMNYTTFGRMVVATGSNEMAVRLAGISERRYKFCVYVISGALSAVAGIIYTARTGVGTPITGVGLELDGIATCVIGGALLSGGRGSVLNTVIGVLVLGLIGNVMNLLSVPVYPQQIIKGAIIILAVLVQRIGQR
ncbi:MULTISPECIES: ABC transporter permease [Burkholderia]|nr:MULTISPECIES: ABC transporter permease [Burkholderia]MEB2535432.1 ABC transporter permease [Burkholderia anthinoferrum]MEB2562969.1 ABC transporter permease [Burkholderia anthinoferrum]MCA8105359.1 ABC transporter permease [Burkholderia sp. AU36459]MCA8244745.1 ABC transporter permease [Burkholderia sp. AU32262]MDF3089978.1 ABC transporter permease [Burkholderia semiarida]